MRMAWCGCYTCFVDGQNCVSCGFTVKISNLSSAKPLQLMPWYVRCLSQSISSFFFLATDRTNDSALVRCCFSFDWTMRWRERERESFGYIQFRTYTYGRLGVKYAGIDSNSNVLHWGVRMRLRLGWTTSNVFHTRRISSQLIYIYRAPALHYE